MREHNISQILEKVVEKATIPLPLSIVENELENQWRGFVDRVGGDEKPLLQQLESEGKSKEQILEEWKPAAEKKLKLQLVVNEMVKQEDIKLEENEVEERVQREAENQNLSLEEAKEAMKRNNYLEYLKYDMKNEKLYDLLLDKGVSNKGKKVKFLDLVQGNY